MSIIGDPELSVMLEKAQKYNELFARAISFLLQNGTAIAVNGSDGNRYLIASSIDGKNVLLMDMNDIGDLDSSVIEEGDILKTNSAKDNEHENIDDTENRIIQ